MPKVKRFQNPLKSRHQPQCNPYPPPQGQVHSSSSLHSQPETPIGDSLPAHVPPPDVQVPLGASSSLHSQPETPIGVSPPAHVPPPNVQVPSGASSNSSIPQEISPEAPPRRAGRESAPYWTVEVIDSEGAISIIKLKVKEVNNLTNEKHIIVNFDEFGAAYGEAQALLAGYCGTLATDCNLFPIHFSKWSDKSALRTPKHYFHDCFQLLLKPRFCFRTTEEVAKRYCNFSIKEKWSSHRLKLWNEFFDPALSRDEIISNVPTGIHRDQWAAYVHYRLKPSTQMCRRNKEIRSKQKISHTGGSKANSRRRHEMFIETGSKVGRGKIFIETHKHKNGSFVNDEAKQKAEEIERIMCQSSIDESEISPNDAVGKVFGEEHSGRVRAMGMGAAPTNTFRNIGFRLNNLSQSSMAATPSGSSNYWKERYLCMENALKSYMIFKEGKIPEEMAHFFSCQSQPSDVASQDIRTSSDGSNTNRQANI